MNKWQLGILSRLNIACNALGGELDGTATNRRKYIDRQRAHMLTSTIILGVCGDDKRNDYREQDMEEAEEALVKLEALVTQVYPDIHGNWQKQ